MTKREEEIRKQASIYGEPEYLLQAPNILGIQGFIQGAKWADKTMIEKICKCYCDHFCGKSICGMCFHKYDHEQQVKSTFNYTECDDLQFIRKNLLE